MKTTFKRALSVILALCVLLASATCLMGISVFAEEPNNVAAKSLEGLTTYEQRSERVLFSKQNNTAQGCAWMAFDGNDSNNDSQKWFPNAASNQWIIIDLNAHYSISQISVSQHTGRSLKYKVYAANFLPGVEYSQTNAAAVHDYIRDNGTIMVDRSSNKTQGVVSDAVSDVKARYVMIDVASSTGGNIVIQEMQIMGVTYVPDAVTYTNDGAPATENNIAYNYISSLSTSEEKQAAVLASVYNQSPSYPYKAFDGVVAGDGVNGNKWFSNVIPSATAPQYLIVDLGGVYNLTGLNITFLEATRDHTYTVHTITDLGDVKYEQANSAAVREKIYTDGTQIVAQNKHSQSKSYQLNGAEGRYVLVNITACGANPNIKELEIYGYSLASATAEIDEENKTITVPGGLGLTVNDLINGLSVKGNAYALIEKDGKDVIENGDYLIVNHGATGVNQSPAILPGPTAYVIKLTSPNLALSKPAIANKFNNNYDPAYAVNGDTAGRQWMAEGVNTTDKPWIIVDLGATYTLSSLNTYFASGIGYSYEVYVADTLAAEWNADNAQTIGNAILTTTPVATVNYANAMGSGTTDLSATGRYVLVKFTARNNGGGTLSLFELEIFGYTFESNELEIDNAKNTISVPYSWGKNVTTDMIASDLTVDKAFVSFNDAGDALTLTYSKGNIIATKTYTILYPNFASVAISKPALANKFNAGYGPAYAVNGDTAGRQWMAEGVNTADKPWIIVDLGATYNLSSLTTYFASGIGYSYEVYVADTLAAEWNEDNAQTIGDAILTTSPVATVNYANAMGSGSANFSATGRYVLVKFTARNNGGGTLSLFELEIFGYALDSKSGNVKFDYENNTIITPFVWGNDVTIADVLADISVLGNAYLTATGDKIVVSTMSGDTVEYTLECGKADDEFANAYVNVHNNISNALNFYNKDDQKITLADAKVDDTIKVSFEYYTSTSQIYQLMFEGTATATSNQGVRLSVGRNKFEQTITVTGEGDITPYLKKLSGGNAIYVWNITIEFNGVDQNVTYANAAGTTTYLTKDEAGKTLGIDLSKDHFVTKYDLSTLDPSTVTQNMLVGAFMGSNVHVPVANDITVSYDYFLPGDAAGVFATTAANNTSGNPAAAIEGNALKFGLGSISGTSTQKMSGAVSAMAAIGIDAGAEIYPDSFYVWNLKLETEDFGTITYIEVPQSQINAYKDSATDRTILSGFSFTKTSTAVTAGEETTYLYADVPSDIVYGNVNGIDDVVDICDLVYLNNADSTFKDIRAFDVDKDSAKSDADYQYVIKQIWKDAFKSAPLATLIGNNIPISSITQSKVVHSAADGNYIYGQGACTDGEYMYLVVGPTSGNLATSGTTIRKHKLSDGSLVKTSAALMNIGKGNDLTYNPKLNRIVYVGTKQLTLINPDSLEIERTIDISVSVSSIAYNEKLDCYAICTGYTMYMLGADFNVIKEYIRDGAVEGTTEYTKQGAGTDGQYIYFPMSSDAADFNDRDNLVVVYDWNFNYVTTLTIEDANESESLFFANGKCYVSYNISGSYVKKLNFTIKSDDIIGD